MGKKTPAEVLDGATDLAITELHRRLEEQPELFSDGTLQKMVESLEKRAERQAKAAEAAVQEESEPFALLDVLDTFPLKRAHKLAVSERDRLLEEARALDDWLDANPVQPVVPVDDGAGWKLEVADAGQEQEAAGGVVR